MGIIVCTLSQVLRQLQLYLYRKRACENTPEHLMDLIEDRADVGSSMQPFSFGPDAAMPYNSALAVSDPAAEASTGGNNSVPSDFFWEHDQIFEGDLTNSTNPNDQHSGLTLFEHPISASNGSLETFSPLSADSSLLRTAPIPYVEPSMAPYVQDTLEMDQFLDLGPSQAAVKEFVLKHRLLLPIFDDLSRALAKLDASNVPLKLLVGALVSRKSTGRLESEVADQVRAKIEAVVYDRSTSLPTLLQSVQVLVYLSWLGLIDGFNLKGRHLLQLAWDTTCLSGFSNVDYNETQGCCMIHGCDKHEIRRTILSLFILDRSSNFLGALPFIIDERRLHVTLQDFLESPNLSAAKVPIVIQKHDGRLYTIIYKAYDVLGKAWVNAHRTPERRSNIEPTTEQNDLSVYVAQLRMLAPENVPHAAVNNELEIILTLWLLIVLDTATGLIGLEEATQISSHGNQTEPLDRSTAAARNTARLIKVSSSVSLKPLRNPHLSPLLFLNCHVLIVAWAKAQSYTLDQEIHLLCSILERLEESFGAMAGRFAKTLRSECENGRHSAESLDDETL